MFHDSEIYAKPRKKQAKNIRVLLKKNNVVLKTPKMDISPDRYADGSHRITGSVALMPGYYQFKYWCVQK
jgi:hypothetical protein